MYVYGVYTVQYKYVRTHTYMCVHVCTYIHTYVHVYIHTYVRVYRHAIPSRMGVVAWHRINDT